MRHMMEKPERNSRDFDVSNGDQIAQKPGYHIDDLDGATLDFDEAMSYARLRAIRTRRRQRVRKHNKHGWWVVTPSIIMEE